MVYVAGQGRETRKPVVKTLVVKTLVVKTLVAKTHGVCGRARA